MPFLRFPAIAIVFFLAFLPPAIASAQAISNEAVAELIRAALFLYFDPSSVFEISVANARVSGDTVTIDDLTIVGKPAFLRGVRGEFLLRTSDLQLDAAGLYEQRVRVRRTGKATVVARSTAGALAEALGRASPAIIGPSIKLHAGEFEVTARLKREGKLYPTQAQGRFVVEGGQRVRVTVTQARVSGGDVPQGTVEKELAKINPILDLSRWPLDLRIQRLNLHNNVVELLATK